MSFASDRRLGLARTSDLSVFQTRTTTTTTKAPPAASRHGNASHNANNDDSDGYYYDDSEEEEEDRLLSARHGEAQEAGATHNDKKRKLTDAEIAAEYNDSKKVPSNRHKPRTQRKVMMDEQDLIKPDGLSAILMNFPRQFEHKNYKNNRKDMAKFSLHLITAYQQWANKIVPGTPLEDVFWKIQSMNSKTSVKLFLQSMRNEVRNQHVERIFGLEKAQHLLSQLDDSYGETELPGDTYDGVAAVEAATVTTTNEPGEETEASSSAVTPTAPVNLSTTQGEIQDMNGQDGVVDEDDYLDMNDMVPVEEDDYPDIDMHDTVPVVATQPPQPTTGVVPETVPPITNPVPPHDITKSHRRFIDHFESSDDEENVVRAVVPANAPRRTIVVDSDDDNDDDEAAMPKQHETRGSDKVDSVEKDPISDKNASSVVGAVNNATPDPTPDGTDNVDDDDIPS